MSNSAPSGPTRPVAPSIGVVIVTFRGGESVSRTLEALDLARRAVAGRADVSVTIVDNASNDGTIGRVRRGAPWATVIPLAQNVGFAAGCNLGIREMNCESLIVLLNPDVRVQADFFEQLLQLQWPPDLAARGPAIFNSRGELEQSARGFPTFRTGLFGRTSLLARVRPQSRLLRQDLVAELQSGARAVDWVSGACLVAPAPSFRSIGLLDEGYFMYWEDADWCWRAHRRGYSVFYEPRLAVVHDQGSSSQSRIAASTVSFHRSAFRYWRLNGARSTISIWLAAVALTLRCVLKLTIALLRHGVSGVRSALSVR